MEEAIGLGFVHHPAISRDWGRDGMKCNGGGDEDEMAGAAGEGGGATTTTTTTTTTTSFVSASSARDDDVAVKDRPPVPAYESAPEEGRPPRRRRRWQQDSPVAAVDPLSATFAPSLVASSSSSSSPSTPPTSSSSIRGHDIPSEPALLGRPPEHGDGGGGVKDVFSAAAERARAIAMRFRKEDEDGMIVGDASIPADVEYARLRREHFERERRRLSSFRLKNLEYVMRREEGELRRHVECMDQMTQYEERLMLHKELQDRERREHRMRMEEREEARREGRCGMSNEGGGGVGTREQRRASRAGGARHPSGGGPPPPADGGIVAPDDRGEPPRTSLYLTNLPVDGSTTERTLRSLFGAYGGLDRVTMYRCRSTGELKGDGLVVFGRDAVAEGHDDRRAGGRRIADGGDDGGSDLVGVVCAQVRG